MALKSRNWFLKQCLAQERNRTKFAYLSATALDLGFGRDNTQSHILHACGATQKFLTEYPNHKEGITAASPIEPYKPRGSMRRDWVSFLANNLNFNSSRFGYNLNTLRSCLTRKHGGICT